MSARLARRRDSSYGRFATDADERCNQRVGGSFGEQLRGHFLVVVGRLLRERAQLFDEQIVIARADVVGGRRQLPRRVDLRGVEHALDVAARGLGHDEDREAVLAGATRAAAAMEIGRAHV